MPLIIESYTVPYQKITSLLFPNKQFTYIDAPVSEPAEELFCYTRDVDDVERIKYYFNRIYYVEAGKIVCINKTAQKIKLYDFITGKPIVFETKVEEDPVLVSKDDFLPQLQAQNGEIVIFPDQDSDEE